MSYVVFSDVGGTVFEGTPWATFRKHPLYKTGQGNIEFVKFMPTYFLTKLNIVNESDMRKRWLAGMAQTFKGLTRAEVTQIYQDSIANEFQNILRQDVVEQLQMHKKQGATVILVSGIFEDFVQMLAEHIGIDGAIGTKIEYENDVVAGSLYGKPCVGMNKIEYIKQYMSDNHPNVDMQDCYGYADSYSDRALLSAVGHGIATYPDDDMREIAIASGWQLFPA